MVPSPKEKKIQFSSCCYANRVVCLVIPLETFFIFLYILLYFVTSNVWWIERDQRSVRTKYPPTLWTEFNNTVLKVWWCLKFCLCVYFRGRHTTWQVSLPLYLFDIKVWLWCVCWILKFCAGLFPCLKGLELCCFPMPPRIGLCCYQFDGWNPFPIYML